MSPTEFYVNEIKNLEGVECICQLRMMRIHYLTIINEKNNKTCDLIYDIELKMHEKFKNNNFQFSVYQVANKTEMDMIINDQIILFKKE